MLNNTEITYMKINSEEAKKQPHIRKILSTP